MKGRREFLIGCGIAVTTAGLGRGSLLAPAGAHGVRLTRDTFKGLLDSSFTFADAATGRRAVADLVEVRSWPPAPNLDRFSLVFRGRPGAGLPEGRYRVTGESAGPFELFVIPVPGEQRETLYRADFSLLV